MESTTGNSWRTWIRSSPVFRSEFFFWVWLEGLLGLPCHLLCILLTGLVLLSEIPVLTLSFGTPSVKMAVLPTFGAWLPNVSASRQTGSSSELESGSQGTRVTPRPWDPKALSNSARLSSIRLTPSPALHKGHCIVYCPSWDTFESGRGHLIIKPGHQTNCII